jgi:hypothetical protein
MSLEPGVSSGLLWFAQHLFARFGKINCENKTCNVWFGGTLSGCPERKPDEYDDTTSMDVAFLLGLLSYISPTSSTPGHIFG